MRPIRLLLWFTLAPLAFDSVRSLFVALWQRFVYLPSISSHPTNPFLAVALQFGNSAVQFAIIPCLLFAVLYLLGKRVRVTEELGSIAVSLFLGGFVGGVIGFLAVIPIYSSPDPSSYVNYLGSFFRDGWTLGNLLVGLLSTGLYSLFIGVTAALFAELRARPDESENASTPGVRLEPSAPPPV